MAWNGHRVSHRKAVNSYHQGTNTGSFDHLAVRSWGLLRFLLAGKHHKLWHLSNLKHEKKQHSINYLRVQYDRKFFGYVFFSWNMLKLILWISMHYLWITSTQISYCHSHRWKIHPEVAGQESPVGLSNLTPHMVRHSTRCAISEGQVICGKNAHYIHDIYIYASVYVLYVVYVM